MKKQLSEKANKEKISFSLTLGQTALYFLHINSPESSAYNVAFTTRILSPVDINALKKSFQKLLNRHPSLRTNFKLADGKPVQEVSVFKDIYFREIDASGFSFEELKEKVSDTNKIPFDLESGDLFKIYLYKESPDNFVLLISMHHIIADGWSIGILIDELWKLYKAETEGKNCELPVNTKKFSDLVNHETSYLASSKAQGQLEYWRNELNNIPVLDLPSDKIRPPVQNFNGATEYFTIEKSIADKFKKLSQTEGATLFATLLAAYQIFLHKYSGQDDIVTGIPTAGRELAGFDNIVGYFINPVAIRTSTSDNPSFKKFLTQVKKKILDARSNQELPYAVIVEKLLQKRDSSRSPVFQTFFGLQKFLKSDEIQEMFVPGNEDMKIKMADLDFKSFHIPQQEGQFDITAEFVEGKRIFSGAFKYNTELFESETVRRMSGHFINLLSDIAANPDKKLSEINLLSDAEKNKIIYEWNQTDFKFDNFKCVHKLFEEQAEKTPEEAAVVFEDETLTYSELNKRSNQLSNYLSRLGVKPGETAGLCAERSLEMVIGILGILKSGGAYMPIDVNYPKDRIEYMMRDSGTKILITQKKFINDIPENIDKIIFIDDWDKIKEESEKNFISKAGLKDLAYVIYTSGSTGNPKGVMINHESLTNHMLWMIDRFKPDSTDAVIQKTPFSFDASVWEFYLPLMTGGRLVMAKPDGHMNTFYLSETIIKKNVTILQVVPSLLRLLLNENEFEKCKSLRKIFSGGEQLTIDLKDKLLTKLDAELYNFYGPTEATIDSIYSECKKEDKTISIGRPIYNTQAYIVDRYMNPVPIGNHGELLLGGIDISSGYINNPELTGEKFIKDEFKKDGGMLYKTGDLTKFRADGSIEYLGRIDRQVKLRGFRIELEEIESGILKYKGIVSSAVIVREDKSGNQRIAAYIVKDNSKKIEADEIKNFLRLRLPEYMIPNTVTFLDKLPLLPNGKTDRDQLPLPEAVYSKEKKFIEPEGEKEKILAGIWEEVMRIEKISTDENFFLLGGDSIISIQIISKAYQSGIKITPKQIFQFQTIKELARVAEETDKTETEQGIVTGEVNLTPIQRWFFGLNFKNPDNYVHSVVVDVPGSMDENILDKAFNELVRHHDSLRLRFKRQGDNWKQTIAEPGGNKIFSCEETSTLTEDKFKKEIELQKRNIDIAKGFLISGKLYRNRKENAGMLLILIHHLSVDGISWRIILEDLYKLYNQIRDGINAKLPSKTTSFKQWSYKLTDYGCSKKFSDRNKYWLTISDFNSTYNKVNYLEDNTIDSTETLNFEINKELTHSLLKKVPQTYNTQINDILLAALALAIKEWNNEEKITIDIEGHGREELFEGINLSRTTGWFTSIFPHTLDISNCRTTGESIKRIKENLRMVPENGIGYGLMRYLSDDEEVRLKLSKIESNKIIFNYLGQFNERIAIDSEWKIGNDAIKLSQDNENIRSHEIEINSIIINEKLKVEITYSRKLNTKEEMFKMLNLYEDSIKKIILHCMDPESGGYTPSDFSASGLNQQELDNLLSNLN